MNDLKFIVAYFLEILLMLVILILPIYLVVFQHQSNYWFWFWCFILLVETPELNQTKPSNKKS